MSEATQRRPAPDGLRKAAPLLALLLAILAAWFGWSGAQQWRQAHSATALEQARDAVLAQTSQALAAAGKRFSEQLRQPAAQAALARGDAAAAAQALREGWKEAEDAQVLAGDLSAGYADVERFGYGRLALLEKALLTDAVASAVVRDGGGARLGLAAPVTLDTGPGVAYLRLPLHVLTAPVAQATVPASGYLALRQGSYDVIGAGDSGLADHGDALSRPIGKTGLRVVAALPDAEAGPLGLDALPCLIVAGLLGFLTLAVLLAARGRLPRPSRAKADAAGAAQEPTLRQSLQQQEPPPAPPLPEGEAAPARLAPAQTVPAAIFRAYDIRGVVGRDLSPQVAALIGQAIGAVMQEQGLNEVVVGRDGRLSGPELSAALIEGLRRAGCHVTDIGLAPTPVVYFASFHLRAGSCVAVTGSHNPPDYNGFKIVVGGETLSGAAITDLYARISEGRLPTAAEPGRLEQRDVGDDYIQRIADDVQLDRPLKVVADAGNGVGGELAPRLLEAIGAEVIPLYCDVDGTFPNHHPDPSEPHNLEDLIQTVKRFDADLGIAFDGDADRLGVVTKEGTVIYPDRLLMLFAADVLQRNPGALVIYDVKCTGKLSDYVLRNGGSPMVWKTGHSLIKAKMRETDAELAGEMSGHFFFKERWYGFDDGLYAAARLLEILAQREESPSEVLAELPDSVSTPEIKLPLDGHDAHALVAQLVVAAQQDDSPFAGARLLTIDGLRADFPDGWGLVRASNTTPVLVLRFEADSSAALERIKDLFRSQLQALLPSLAPGF
ncbi:phosphomannomutase/phosphoglucomutase [Xanthomonas sp. NCPPB 2654]|uniref:phosphomannomutase/phosphoglucomutase n=1 Tax=unclassified Xanthomonas TaxID=2643310 RepID=UPI0021DFA809|nr:MULTISPECIES: phosphomannomutase/phosphoglucomutase [unclassified Xanthomonas]MDL5364381.1 phosphomannomutase/phosphoglucomutase [Xanthomonas sp. NCPPB 2654]UYC20326.1 phosphomannomutase/phosphoglucomutase [Xanthomonas sp. CFBP 8443]